MNTGRRIAVNNSAQETGTVLQFNAGGDFGHFNLNIRLTYLVVNRKGLNLAPTADFNPLGLTRMAVGTDQNI
ncbi:MAG: hypothetical protein HOE30_06820 [Deltaproteobacteria bacterium]|jgi:hypothetical protein|nr:hypothetical protein [Deltaproteobacteria bacterium]MBT4266556.1 hypothetical protein [Deltaproteobacteria bacterium]MBT4643527.1 hypothetical protein [Deltaproteobacteria bacterium]MBT6500899.1 hypothetical protein [Deltaproteobacteria bacterium]MBT7154019.1 hypothetical protein [Deltaproteobacteria bacterium]